MKTAKNLRRTADPDIVRRFYHIIEVIRHQRQIANLKRVVKSATREYGITPKECLISLHKAITDDLVIETVTVGCKGAKVGVEQEGYWIPSKDHIAEIKLQETHDWYCFSCHKPGEVVCCTTCFRVFHKECIDSAKALTKFKCEWCQAAECSATDQERLALGKCLYFVVTHQKDYWKDLATQPSPSEYPYYDFFVYSHYDLEMLQADCHNCIFKSSQEFLARALQIQHNLTVGLGEDHAITKLAQQFVEDCSHELQELRLCRTCFYLSNTKPMKDWFCKPCEPPHQVVWAKQKGFEYWPAKIIQVETDRVDVRFFGRHHPRAWIPIDSVRAISVSPTELKIKRKQQWKQASDEMKEYIRQCECALGKDEASKIILYDSPYGIGKNAELLAAMESQSAQISPGKKAKTTIPIHETCDTTHSQVATETNGNDVTSDDDSLKEDLLDDSLISPAKSGESSRTKRKAEAEDGIIETNGGPVKRLKMNDESSPEKDHAKDLSEEFEKLKKSADCGCKSRYETILLRFRDYLVEANRLEKQKFLRSAAMKSAYEQDQVSEKLEAEYEEKIRALKEKHEKEIIAAKTQNWCKACLKPASEPCCPNPLYCEDCRNEQEMDESLPCTSSSLERGRRAKRARS